MMKNNNYPSLKQRKRGCLGLWLAAGIILNPLMVILTVIEGQNGVDLCLTLGFGIVNFICFLAVWNWEKWGVYGLFGSFSVSLTLSMFVGNVAGILSGIVSLFLLAYLTDPVMDVMN